MKPLCAALACLSLAGCGVALTPALIGAGIGLASATLNADTEAMKWYLCRRGEGVDCQGSAPVPTLALCTPLFDNSPCLYVAPGAVKR